MHRSFERSRSRRRTYLDGRWEFATGAKRGDDGPKDGDGGPESGDRGDAAQSGETLETAFDGDVDRMTVPGSWQTRAAYHDHHGTAWYRRTVRLPAATNLRLHFEAVAHEATVYVDGEEVCAHRGGYTPFEVVLPNVEAGDHELVVRADSQLDETTIPKPDTDWFPYGGITREVFYEAVPDVFVDDLRVEYDLDGNAASVEATVDVRNLGDETEASVGVEIDGESSTDTETLPPGATTVSRTLEVEGVERWSPKDPRLYHVVATAGDDDLRERVGFRDVECSGREIRINGEAVEVRGVNRHEDHPEWGHAQPTRLMELDLDVLEDGGYNAVRTSHYPNHPRFLDYCDEAGLLVIEEIPYWQFGAEQFERGDVLELGRGMLAEMIERDYHHPSVLAWSLHNECGTDSAGVYEATEALASTARERDGTRPLTYATNTDYSGGTDVCDDLVDFVCLNAYWGWYSEDSTWATFLDDVAETYPDKPILVSEFGAGAVAGERTFDRQKWSETYQAELLVDAVETIRDHDSVAGFTVWQYCDTRTQPSGFGGRPKTKNNKGIVDEYRRPKDAYWALRELLTGAGIGDQRSN